MGTVRFKVKKSLPRITSGATASVAENVVLAKTITANQNVSWTKSGTDSALFEFVAPTTGVSSVVLRWLANTTRNFESPADGGGDNIYNVNIIATNATSGQSTTQANTITVTNVDEVAPTITSGASASVAENAILAHALTANETVTWSIRTAVQDAASVDHDKFQIFASTLAFKDNLTRNYEAPDDTGTNNTYVVVVRATDLLGNATDQTFTATVTDVVEGSAPAATIALLDHSTTGSMTLGSFSLVCADATDFAIGQSIIVEVGGEAGAGMRNTTGVGGTFPAQSAFASLYYYNTPNPKALMTTITGKAGNTLTLAHAATVATTNANVYLDNYPIWLAFLAANTGPNVTMTMPAGVFATSKQWDLVAGSGGRHGWTIQGQHADTTEVFSPRGCHSFCFLTFQCNTVTMKNFHLRGNARDNGFGLHHLFLTDYPGGVHFKYGTGCVAQDMKVTDVFQKAVGVDYGTDCFAYRVEFVSTEGLQRYIQWWFQWANCTGGGAVDCTATSANYTAGFETFASEGTEFLRCQGVNVIYSVNDAGTFNFEDCSATFEPLLWTTSLQFNLNNPVMNLNTNFSAVHAANGGTITNFTINYQGYVSSARDLFKGIVIAPLYEDIVIDGGSYSGPNADTSYPGNATLGTLAINGQATFNTQVTNFTVYPTQTSGLSQIYVKHGNAVGCSTPNPASIVVTTVYP